ncbi:Calcineurin-like_phosphoesterase [Hexamita inflata]|uniref:Calcineurin-like_phosphoesterase n=1 Tax=Hexamita inflata TaxID=28002 RepID=A0ABP1HBV7_9EUKA
MKLLFASDFHGNEQHIAACCDISQQFNPDAFIYLGDFSPNRFMYDTPTKCDEYNQRVFFPKIASMNAKKKFVISGNTDFHESKNLYKQLYTDPTQVEFLTDGIRDLNENISVLFCSLTKYSPHSLKDGECLDQNKPFKQKVTQRVITAHGENSESSSLESSVSDSQHSSLPCGRQRAGSLTTMQQNIVIDESHIDPVILQEHNGIEKRVRVKYVKEEKIATHGMISKPFDPSIEQGSELAMDALSYDMRYFQQIDVLNSHTQPEWFQKQHAESLECYFNNQLQNNKRVAIWASHGPVYNTVADRLRSGDHVGSKAMRKAMCTYKPDLIVSGHIHETCRDGEYKQYEQIDEEEICICAVGNEGLVMPFCLSASFVLVEINDQSGKVIHTQRKTVLVNKYDEAELALAKFKETVGKIKK